MWDLDHIVERVRAHTPVTSGRVDRSPRAAATALILHEPPRSGPEVLFIQRTERTGDRWSGHMALPGGRRHPEDPDLIATAVRETHEEVGVRLGEPIGRLDDHAGLTSGALVATYVFTVDHRPELTLEEREVADAVWVPVEALRSDETSSVTMQLGVIPFPAIRYEGYTIWGLTHRIIGGFLSVLG